MREGFSLVFFKTHFKESLACVAKMYNARCRYSAFNNSSQRCKNSVFQQWYIYKLHYTIVLTHSSSPTVKDYTFTYGLREMTQTENVGWDFWGHRGLFEVRTTVKVPKSIWAQSGLRVQAVAREIRSTIPQDISRSPNSSCILRERLWERGRRGAERQAALLVSRILQQLFQYLLFMFWGIQGQKYHRQKRWMNSLTIVPRRKGGN
jgi:hypothetical protein